MSNSEGSVTILLGRLRDQDPEAAGAILRRYADALVRFVRTRLAAPLRPKVDPEDVVQSVFGSFFRCAANFPDLSDRNDLWQVLLMLTSRKSATVVRYFCASRRDVRREVEPAHRGLAPLAPEAVEEERSLIDDEPSPEAAVAFADEVDRLLRRLDELGDARLRPVVELKLGGYTEEEIATALGCSVRTVRRKLDLVRRIWTREEWP